MTKLVYQKPDAYGNVEVTYGKKTSGSPFACGYLDNGILRILEVQVPESKRRSGIGLKMVTGLAKKLGAKKIRPHEDIRPGSENFWKEVRKIEFPVR